jgi:hypothetical protein
MFQIAGALASGDAQSRSRPIIKRASRQRDQRHPSDRSAIRATGCVTLKYIIDISVVLI